MSSQVRFAEFVIEMKSEFVETSQPQTALRTNCHVESYLTSSFYLEKKIITQIKTRNRKKDCYLKTQQNSKKIYFASSHLSRKYYIYRKMLIFILPLKLQT
jgi:hypothetical protein